MGDGTPGAPGNLTITAGDRELTLSWEPPNDNGNASGRTYRVEWRKEGQDYHKDRWAPVRKTTYTKTQLSNGTSYTFRVKAKKGNGYGPSSEEVSGTPTSGMAVDLSTPVLSEPEALHYGMVKLDWEDLEDAGWYEVQYYHIDQGSAEWLELPAVGVDVALHGFERGGEQPGWAVVAPGSCGELCRSLRVIGNRVDIPDQGVGLGGRARTHVGGGRRDRTMPRSPGHAGAVGAGNPASRHGEAGLGGPGGRRLV